MAKKPKITKKEIYSLKLQDLMDAIPTSAVAKHITEIEGHRWIEWVVDGYTVHSYLRDVYSIGFNDTANLEFILKREDYKNFVQACEKRRAELREQMKTKKR